MERELPAHFEEWLLLWRHMGREAVHAAAFGRTAPRALGQAPSTSTCFLFRVRWLCGMGGGGGAAGVGKRDGWGAGQLE